MLVQAVHVPVNELLSKDYAKQRRSSSYSSDQVSAASDSLAPV